MFVVTFYSYKGGVGRTMALANVAALLARENRRVLVVDFDLEAPGIPSYGPFNYARFKPGIVDYVSEYIATGIVPDAAELIVRCPLDKEHAVWVMPAGDNSVPDYSDRLARIDWGHLYNNRHGAMLLEDMREQWRRFEDIGFDYVLIDSRTGNTDVGGICTRQLPDAVVAMFVPTEQNIDGLVPVIDLVRSESDGRDKGIELVFCPSNVPDLFDEDDILGKLLKRAAERLHYGNPAELEPPVVRIHHWTDMELLEQPIIVETREKSRLSSEYRDLKTAVIGLNSADREGAAFALRRMLVIYGAARKAQNSRTASKVLERTAEIALLHPDDGRLALEAAEIFSEAGDYEREERSLSDAIRAGEQIDRAVVLRAVARVNLNKKAEALEDVRTVLSSVTATSFEFRPAVQILRAIAEEPVVEALAIFEREETKPRTRIQLAPLLMQHRKYLGLVADRLLDALGQDSTSAELRADISNTAALALIGAGRFAEALALTEKERKRANVAAMFNAAIAEWGASGHPPTDSFYRLDELLTDDQEADQNVHQCVALVRAAVGRADEALHEIERAEERVLPSGLAFSCWTFTYRTGEEFQADLAAMRVEISEGRMPNPPFLIDARSF